jgi:hypothetical protein
MPTIREKNTGKTFGTIEGLSATGVNRSNTGEK